MTSGLGRLSVCALTLGIASFMGSIASAQTSGTSEFLASDSTVASAVGKEVHVRTLDTKSRGTLVSLSSLEVVLRQDGTERRVPLSSVRRIETVSHHVRNGALVGLAAGVLSGVIVVAAMNYTDEGRLLAPLVNGGIGLGSGLAIGALVSSATADRRLIYGAGAGSPVGTMLAPRRPVVALVMQW